jgi:hypothetical protein
VYLPILVTAEAGVLVRPERMDRPAVTIPADELLHKNMTRVAGRFIHHERSLRRLMPMTSRTGLPWRFIPMRLRRLLARRKNELYEQPILLDQTKAVAILAYDIPVTGKLPGRVRLFHKMTAVAKFRVLLDVIIIPDRHHYPQNRDDEHERDEDDFLIRTQAPFEPVYNLCDNVIHGEGGCQESGYGLTQRASISSDTRRSII